MNVKFLLCSVLLLFVSACAQIELGPPVASSKNLSLLKSSPLSAMELGDFSATDGASWEKSISVRTNALKSPIDESYSAYLKASLAVELNAAGLLSEDSDFTVNAVLLENEIDAAIGTGTAKISAQFKVDKKAITVFNKIITVQASWDSSFVGATAIPDAMNQYAALHRTLLSKLFQDDQFLEIFSE